MLWFVFLFTYFTFIKYTNIKVIIAIYKSNNKVRLYELRDLIIFKNMTTFLLFQDSETPWQFFTMAFHWQIDLRLINNHNFNNDIFINIYVIVDY